MFTLRVDVEDPDALIMSLGRLKYYLQREVSDDVKKVHYQGFIDSSLTLNHLRNRHSLGVYLRGLPRAAKSLADMKDESIYLGYILKNTSKDYVSETHTSFSSAELDQFRSRAQEFIKAKPPTKKLSRSFTERIVDDFKSQYYLGDDLYGESLYQELSKTQISNFVVSYFLKNNSKCPLFQMRDIAQYLLSLSSLDSRRNLAEKISEGLL